ncbi:MAG: hypothetical protein AAB855_00580 [Patescibacteria group bacterium]
MRRIGSPPKTLFCAFSPLSNPASCKVVDILTSKYHLSMIRSKITYFYRIVFDLEEYQYELLSR